MSLLNITITSNVTDFRVSFEQDFKWINIKDYDESTQILALATTFVILILILPITKNVLKSKTNFINILILMDCFNSAAHIPILLQILE